MEVEWAEGRKTEEKAHGKPCANVSQHRMNYHHQNVSSQGWVCIEVQEGMFFILSEHNIPGLKHRLPQ